MLLFWLIGIVIVFIAALVIIKLIVGQDPDPDSNLGILEHPSTFQKQSVEYVDKTLGKEVMDKKSE